MKLTTPKSSKLSKLGKISKDIAPYGPIIVKMLAYFLLLCAAIAKSLGYIDLATSLLAIGSIFGLKDASEELKQAKQE